MACDLHYEETGSGSAVIFMHEFAGDHRSWEPQMRHFGRRHRCIAFNARGYSPSDVPEEVGAYSQARAADDVRSVLDRPVELNHGHAELSFLRNLRRGTTGLAAASPLRFSEPFRAGSGECPQLARGGPMDLLLQCQLLGSRDARLVTGMGA